MEPVFIVGFSRPKSNYKLMALIIRLVEKRDYNHAYIRYIDELTKEELISQASHGYVNEVNLNVFKDENLIIKEYKITSCESGFLDILKFNKQNLGKKYSYFQILMIGIKKIFRLNNIKDDNKSDKFICSEWAAYICKLAKIPVPENLDTFTPSDLDRLLETMDDCMETNKVELL